MFQQTNIDEEVDAQLEKSSCLSNVNNITQQQNLTLADLAQQKSNNNAAEKCEAKLVFFFNNIFF